MDPTLLLRIPSLVPCLIGRIPPTTVPFHYSDSGPLFHHHHTHSPFKGSHFATWWEVEQCFYKYLHIYIPTYLQQGAHNRMLQILNRTWGVGWEVGGRSFSPSLGMRFLFGNQLWSFFGNCGPSLGTSLHTEAHKAMGMSVHNKAQHAQADYLGQQQGAQHASKQANTCMHASKTMRTSE